MSTVQLLQLNKKQRRFITYKVVVIALFALMIIIMTWLLTYASYATSGNELENLETQKRAYMKGNDQLTLDIAKSTSLPQIEQNAKQLGMNKNSQSIVIKAKVN